jgi:hypothetical protein
MMGRLKRDQEQLFYSFCLEEAIPDDHLVRAISAVLDLSWVHDELEPYYSRLGRPSVDPALMIRMLIVGYVFAIRSERALCREVVPTANLIPLTGTGESGDSSLDDGSLQLALVWLDRTAPVAGCIGSRDPGASASAQPSAA